MDIQDIYKLYITHNFGIVYIQCIDLQILYRYIFSLVPRLSSHGHVMEGCGDKTTLHY